MTIQKIDAVVSPTEVEEILAILETIRQKLPFLVGLTPIERRQIPKLGLKSQTFVVQALSVATSHSDLMPRCLNVQEAQRDINLFEALHPIAQSLNQLSELVGDTQMLAGSEAYAAARLAYSSVKTSGKGLGLDGVVDNLSRRFQKTPRKGLSELP